MLKKTKQIFALHNRWSKIKHQKAVNDPAKAATWSKIAKEIKVHSRDGVDSLRLKLLLEKAKKMNVPKKVIDSALQHGGEDEMNQTFFSGFGVGGVGILVVVLTDKMTRTSQDLRKLFTDYSGRVGDTHWMFEQRGYILVEKLDDNELEEIMNIGIKDFEIDEQNNEMEIYSEIDKLGELKEAIEKTKKVKEVEFIFYPTTTIEIKLKKQRETIMELLSKLEDHPDVNHVYHNLSNI